VSPIVAELISIKWK